MSFPWNITNPGFVLGGQLTSQEAAFVTNLAGLTYAQGDVLYHDGADLTNLGIGTAGQVLTVSAGGVPEWTTVAGTGDVTAASAFGTDNRIIRSDGTGKGVQASAITVDDSGNITGAGTLNTHTIPGGTGTFALTSQLHDAVTIAAGLDYVTLSGQELTLNSVDLTTDVTGDLPFSNIAQIATSRLLGRTTAGTGDIEVVTVDGGIEFNGSAIRRSALTGAITASAGNNTTSLGSFTKAQLSAAVSDGTPLYVGDITAGDAWGDAVDADIVPDADGTRDLGSSVNRFAETHTDSLFTGAWNALGSTLNIYEPDATTKMFTIEGGSTANYLHYYTGSTGNNIELWATGTDSNISIALAPKGASGTVVIGDGFSGNSVLESYGNFDLVLQTGNATTGSITITDGANGDIALSPNGTGTIRAEGTIDANSNDITNVELVEFETEVDNGNSSTADTIDWGAGNNQKSTMTGNCTYTFTAPSGPARLQLKLIQDGTGSRTATWPASVKWPGGTAPTLSTAASSVDIITFWYDGTDYYGVASLDFQ